MTDHNPLQGSEGIERKRRIGEQLMDDGLINADQLEQVLKRQAQAGGQLGSILIEMGFVALDDLLELLSRKFGVPGVNLYQRNIKKEVLQLLPVEKMTALGVLPIAMENQTVELAMVNPQDFATTSELEFSLGKKIRPVVMPAFMIASAIRSIAANPGMGLRGEVLSELVDMENGEKSPRLLPLLRYLKKSGANDMVFTAGSPPSIKIANTLKRLAIPALTPDDCMNYAREMLSDEGWQSFSNKTDHDFSARIRRLAGSGWRYTASATPWPLHCGPSWMTCPELPTSEPAGLADQFCPAAPGADSGFQPCGSWENHHHVRTGGHHQHPSGLQYRFHGGPGRVPARA
jgi:hypothetical protein